MITKTGQLSVHVKDKGDDEAMFMTNSPTIQDVLFFPQMRPKSL
jgi:hypothetical protein